MLRRLQRRLLSGVLVGLVNCCCDCDVLLLLLLLLLPPAAPLSDPAGFGRFAPDPPTLPPALLHRLLHHMLRRLQRRLLSGVLVGLVNCCCDCDVLLLLLLLLLPPAAPLSDPAGFGRFAPDPPWGSTRSHGCASPIPSDPAEPSSWVSTRSAFAYAVAASRSSSGQNSKARLYAGSALSGAIHSLANAPFPAHTRSMAVARANTS